MAWVGPVEAVPAAQLGLAWQAEAGMPAPIVFVARSVCQVSVGTVRRRCSTVRNESSPGHRAGSRRVTVRAVRVIRPGTVNSRWRKVRGGRDGRVG